MRDSWRFLYCVLLFIFLMLRDRVSDMLLKLSNWVSKLSNIANATSIPASLVLPQSFATLVMISLCNVLTCLVNTESDNPTLSTVMCCVSWTLGTVPPRVSVTVLLVLVEKREDVIFVAACLFVVFLSDSLL